MVAASAVWDEVSSITLCKYIENIDFKSDFSGILEGIKQFISA